MELGPGQYLRTLDLWRIAHCESRVALSAESRAAVEKCESFVDRLARDNQVIYGVTTGFGPLATSRVAASEAPLHQRNLVYHLASGVGDPLSATEARAVMVSRANVLASGHSGVRLQTLDLLLSWLDAGIAPVIPSLGSVGASGDLTPLAHMTLSMMGESDVIWRGVRTSADSALAELGLRPLELQKRDGLALVNGTSAMTALAALNDVALHDAIDHALVAGMMAAEVLETWADGWDELLGRLRPHAGQKTIHERLAALSASSARLSHRERGTFDQPQTQTGHPLPQDAYTIRCMPQLFGAVLDTLSQHRQTVETELNSVTDNPVFDADEERVAHGGNFYGQHVAFASDAAALAATKLAVWAERIVARITDPQVHQKDLPPFLTPRSAGLDSGLMGAQVSASALVAHMRTHSHPASIQSVPTNANNQDVVTMGTISAWRTRELVRRLNEVLAITLISTAQAVELSQRDDHDGYSESTRNALEWMREHVDFIDADRPLSNDIQRLAEHLSRAPWLERGPSHE